LKKSSDDGTRFSTRSAARHPSSPPVHTASTPRAPLSRRSGVPTPRAGDQASLSYRTCKRLADRRALPTRHGAWQAGAVLVEITAPLDTERRTLHGRCSKQRRSSRRLWRREALKTHVKLGDGCARGPDGIRRYGTSALATTTPDGADLRDLVMLSCHVELGADVAAVFNELTLGRSIGRVLQGRVARELMREWFRQAGPREPRTPPRGRPPASPPR